MHLFPQFVQFEQRDPFLLKQQKNEAGSITMWARYAAMEYARLAMEEEMREQEQAIAQMDGQGGYDGWSG